MKGTEGMGRGGGKGEREREGEGRGREEVREEREKSVRIYELPSFQHWLKLVLELMHRLPANEQLKGHVKVCVCVCMCVG